MPVIALKGMVILPGMLVHLDIKRDISKKAVDEAMAGEGVVFITNQNDENVELPLYKDLRAVGVVAKIRQVMRLEEDVVRALVSTTDRATLLCLNQNEPYLTGDVDVYETDAEITDEVEYEAMCREARQLYEKYLIKNPSVGRSAYDKIQQSKSLGQILDLIMMHIPMSFEMRQCFLECFDMRDRFYYVLNFVGRELDILDERQKFRQAVKTTMEKNQKEYYLREQMRAIRQELGEDGESQADEYRNQADELICSDEVREKIEQEIKRVHSVHIGANEKVQTFLESQGSIPLNCGVTLADLIRRPELNYDVLAPIDPERPELSAEVREQVNINIKYDGYITREIKQVEKFKKLEQKKIPEDFDYDEVPSLRIEARQKLKTYHPISIGQASRISGVSPADISVLLVYMEQLYYKERQ